MFSFKNKIVGGKFLKYHFGILLVFGLAAFSFSHFEAIQKAEPKEIQQDGLQLSNLVRIARVTGKSLPGENFPNPNETVNEYDVGGTDLGIMWAMGDNKIGIFFGDTNGEDFVPFKGKGGGNGRNWRSNVSQVCNAKKDGFVFMIGTLAGRGSAAWLSRFKEAEIENRSAYEYWNGDSGKWVINNEDAATPVIPGPVGEASLLYHEKLKKWIIMYIYDHNHDKDPVVKRHAIVYRDALELNGTWSKTKVLTTSEEYPGLYSPYMHPLKSKGNEIYFTMSLWGPYNVFLMKADIATALPD